MYMICRQTNHDKELGSVSIAVDEEAVLASLDKRSPLQRCETWKGTLADAALSEADVVSSHARDTEEHLSSELHDMVAISETGLTQSSCSQICIHFAGSDERNEWETDMHLCDVCTSEFLDVSRVHTRGRMWAYFPFVLYKSLAFQVPYEVLTVQI